MTSLDEWLARAQWPGFTELRIGGSEEHGFNRRRAMALTDALLASLDADTRGIGPGVSVQAIQMALVQAYLQTFPDDNPLPTLEQVKRMLMERTATLKPAPASSEAAQNRCALLPLMLLNATWSRTLGQRLQACDRLSLLQRSRPALPSP